MKVGDLVTLIADGTRGFVSEISEQGYAVRWSTGSCTGYFPADELRSEISDVHAAADYEALRSHALEAAREVLERLQTCDTALSRPVPKVAIVREVLAQQAYALMALVRHLEGLR